MLISDTVYLFLSLGACLVVAAIPLIVAAKAGKPGLGAFAAFVTLVGAIILSVEVGRHFVTRMILVSSGAKMERLMVVGRANYRFANGDARELALPVDGKPGLLIVNDTAKAYQIAPVEYGTAYYGRGEHQIIGAFSTGTTGYEIDYFGDGEQSPPPAIQTSDKVGHAFRYWLSALPPCDRDHSTDCDPLSAPP